MKRGRVTLADLSIRKMEPPRRITWRTSDLLRATAVFAAVYVALQFLWLASTILFAVFLGILFGVALSAGVDRLAAVAIPRALGTTALVLAFFGLLGLAGTLMAPTVREQAQELRVRLPQALDDVEQWIEERNGLFSTLLSGGDDSRGEVSEEAAEEDPSEEPEEEPVEEPEERPAEQPGEEPAEAEEEAPEEEPEGAEEAPEETADEGQAEAAQAGDAQDEAPPGESMRQRLVEQLGDLGTHLFSFVTSTVHVLGGVLLIIFMAIYIAVNPEVYRQGILLMIPARGREKAAEVLSETSLMLRKWLLTQLVAMVVVGTATAIALTLLDVRAALALGILAGLLEFIPIFGPIIAAVPAIAMGFLESPQTALYVTLVYIVIQQIESQLLVPLLMSEGIDLPPVLTVLSQALMALIFGFLGLLVAVPLVAVAVVVVKMLYVQDVVGEDVLLPSASAE